MNSQKTGWPELVALVGRVVLVCWVSGWERGIWAGPYAPAAGEPGSTAVALTDPALVAWATGWTNYRVGLECDAEWQTPDRGLGTAVGNAFDIVCLGEGGEITLTFAEPIRDGPGDDFAVFENAITDTFLELAQVEVSSDGINFVAFPFWSLTAKPVDPYEAVDPTDVTGLAGKYRQGYATPFDLAEVGMTAAGWVRLLDVLGDGSIVDSEGRKVFDPYPSTGSAGFDLDAVGVLSNAVEEVNLRMTKSIAHEWGGETLAIVVARKSWDPGNALAVAIELSGEARSGEDYELVDPNVIIPAGAAETLIRIRPLADELPEGDETLEVTLSPADGYVVGPRSHASVVLRDRPIDDWRQELFGETAREPAAADGSDPDGDGRVNLMEYLLGSDPRVADPGPELMLVASGVGIVGEHEVRYTRRMLLPDAAVAVQVTFDLSGENWDRDTAKLREEEVSATDGRLLMRAWIEGENEIAEHAFFRLRGYRL